MSNKGQGPVDLLIDNIAYNLHQSIHVLLQSYSFLPTASYFHRFQTRLMTFSFHHQFKRTGQEKPYKYRF